MNPVDYALPFADQPASDTLRRTFGITLELLFTCPQCSEPCGHRFAASGLCLGCHLLAEEQAVAQQQAVVAKRIEREIQELQQLAEDEEAALLAARDEYEERERLEGWTPAPTLRLNGQAVPVSQREYDLTRAFSFYVDRDHELATYPGPFKYFAIAAGKRCQFSGFWHKPTAEKFFAELVRLAPDTNWRLLRGKQKELVQEHAPGSPCAYCGEMVVEDESLDDFRFLGLDPVENACTACCERLAEDHPHGQHAGAR